MLFSEVLGLRKSQPQLDFVDIELDTDTPLFIDPAAFHDCPGYFAQKCAADITSFFDAVLHAAGEGDDEMGERLLAALREPDEIHLGLSKGLPKGRGLGHLQASIIFERIKTSKALKTGLVQDLNDVLMFVRGVGPDIVSDITTNIIRRHLIKYTQDQFDLMGLEINNNIPTGLLWDPVDAKWEEDFDEIPVVKDRRILLVPKRFVKWRYDFSKAGTQYYNKFFINYIRQDQLNKNGPLVSLIPKKFGPAEKKVFKTDIERKFPNTKGKLEEFSTNHPDIYDKFKSSFFRHNPLSINSLMGFHGDDFREIEFTNHIIDALRKLPSGAKHSADYQSMIVGIAHFMFYPELTNPVLERPLNGDRKRIDIAFDNSSTAGFFSLVRTHPFLMSSEVMIECKNYSHDIANPELDQLIGRFDPRRGRFGMLFCREVTNKGRLADRCADAYRSAQGAIIVLTDEDVIEALDAGVFDRARTIERIMSSQMRDLRK